MQMGQRPSAMSGLIAFTAFHEPERIGLAHCQAWMFIHFPKAGLLARPGAQPTAASRPAATLATDAPDATEAAFCHLLNSLQQALAIPENVDGLQEELRPGDFLLHPPELGAVVIFPSVMTLHAGVWVGPVNNHEGAGKAGDFRKVMQLDRPLSVGKFDACSCKEGFIAPLETPPGQQLVCHPYSISRVFRAKPGVYGFKASSQQVPVPCAVQSDHALAVALTEHEASGYAVLVMLALVAYLRAASIVAQHVVRRSWLLHPACRHSSSRQESKSQ
eukprot:CAMPEP_0194769572 /NCGR_PEP_ID=MMETSP0323_2-20130528/43560_1 /TAXON_ID=2866 ORGANISM="Crypthecodinium cohnii, Strain Seligo" /NCGR_SAMPLE_ID=MMETSP0323_2 /ASSEMBLY_ACC=CAM_ASM_000346 /LENGTH=274 /DNA_ID=CAMNT_0039702631 /DNA_START=169 /DNA_END=991 /DNA_ORIENTATION=+